MLGLVLAAVVGIFLLLQACFGSWRLALIAFLALPASIVGGVLAASVSGGIITLGSIVGFLAVLGIAARNGLLLINHYQRLEAEQGMPFGRALVVAGAGERMTPILASSAALIGALLPLVLLGQVPGLEILQPTAVVILGGLVASALVTLFVMPALYAVVGPRATRHADLALEGA
jgi:Cu/Ag efflux pump CusA